LGTIAKSGTSDFLQKYSDESNKEQLSDMIGQFGVGFYSSFLVADRVYVISKHTDDKQYIWESDASGYSIVEDPRGDTLTRGTHIILELKKSAEEFFDPTTVKELIRKYSQFVHFPIYLWEAETVKSEVTEEETSEEKELSWHKSNKYKM